MNNLLQQIADNLADTWEATENQTVCHDILANPEKSSLQLIKKESRVRILLTPPDDSGQRICFKIYHLPRRLRWRTLFSVARAKREFENMVEAHKAGVPVVEPVTWSEERFMGLLRFNAIATVYVPQKDMGELLTDLSSNEAERFKLISSAGKLLAHMHQAGLVWMTALPRNILVKDALNPQPLAFDMPYGCKLERSVVDGTAATYDLYTFIKDGLSLNCFDSDEALAFLNAYCDGDGSKCETLKLRLQKKTSLSHFMDRIFIRSLNFAKANLRRLTQRDTVNAG